MFDPILCFPVAFLKLPHSALKLKNVRNALYDSCLMFSLNSDFPDSYSIPISLPEINISTTSSQAYRHIISLGYRADGLGFRF